MKALSADDDDLLRKLQEIPPSERGAALAHIHRRDWKAEPVWSAAHEWLVLAMRLEHAPESPEINFLFGQVTERLRWVAHRVPGTRATPETLALSGLKSRKGMTIAQQVANANRTTDRKVRIRPLQRLAEDYWKRHPDWKNSRVEKEILSKWRSADGEKPKDGYIRKRIKKPG